MANQFLVGLAILLSGNYMEPRNPAKIGLYSGDRYGLCDANSREIIPPKYCEIRYIGHGLFDCEGIDREDRFCKSGAHFFFNREGEALTPPLPQGAVLKRVLWLGEKGEDKGDENFKTFPDDAIFVFQRDWKLGLFDSKGQVLIEPLYYSISQGAEGLALLHHTLENRKSKTFLIDLRTHQISPLKFTVQNVSDVRFSEGLACVEAVSGKYGYINKRGEFQIPPAFDGAGNFLSGSACVIQSFKSSIIDQKGIVVSPRNLDVEGFRGDYAIASKRTRGDSLKGLVNRKYEFVLQPSYQWIWPFQEVNSSQDYFACATATPKLYIARKDGVRSALSADGKPLFDIPKVESVDGLQFNRIRCTLRSGRAPKYLFLTLDGKQADPAPTYSWSIAPDRLVKCIPGDDGSFDSKYWKEASQSPISRMTMFKNFVTKYKLIGMHTDEVLKHLGAGRSVHQRNNEDPHFSYMVEGGGCIVNLYKYVKIFFDKDNKVTGWCFSQNCQDETLVTSNDLSPAIFQKAERNDHW